MALKADAHRHKDGRRTARALFVQIAAQGYRGGYSLAAYARCALLAQVAGYLYVN